MSHYTYKIKKPVNLEFLDFSMLEKRRYFCEQALALNCRLAPNYYLAVILTSEIYTSPTLGGNVPAIKLCQFPQEEQLDRLLKQDRLSLLHMQQLAEKILLYTAQSRRV